ncbi:MAG: peptidylprolyl isomerase [bacterium]
MRYQMRTTFSLLAISLLTLLLLGGCGSSRDSQVVAIVDGETIELSLIEQYFQDRGFQFESADQELDAKRMAVDSLIDFMILVRGAYDAGLETDKEVNRVVASERSNFLFDELYRQEILPHIEVTDRDYEQFLDKMRTEYRFSHIVVSSKATADSLWEMIKQGTDFGMLARTRSIDQSSAVQGGDLGWISWAARTAPAFREAAFALKVGEVSEPVQTEFGWHLIKNEEERAASLPEGLKELRMLVEDIIKTRRAADAEAELWQRMEKEAHVEINPVATDMLLKKLAEHYPDSINGVARPDNFFPNLELLEQSQRDMLFASYTGGEITVEEYLRKIAEIPDFHRPHFADQDSLANIVFQLELANIMEFEALKRKLDESPDYLQRVQKFKESVMADQFARRQINANISVDPDEMTEYYNSHLEEFMTEPRYHLQEIEHDSLELLKTLQREINQGADFGELAAQYTTREGFKEKKGDLGMVTSLMYPAIYKAVTNLQPGDIAPFVKNSNGRYSLVKVLDVEQGQIRPFEEVERAVRQRLFGHKRDRATVDWVAKKRETMVIEVFDDAIVNSVDRSKYEAN